MRGQTKPIRLSLSASLVAILLLTACSNPNPTCEKRAGVCWELDFSGTGMEIQVGEEKSFQLYSSLYNNGDVIHRRARVNPEDVTFNVGNTNVLRVEVRTSGGGNPVAYMIGVAPGRSSLGAQLRDDPNARAEVIMDVKP